jgi:8-oxo-dGTP pyrophosphatase MutT (NUDIX family)
MFRAAGILFHRNCAGGPEILLGRRRYNPDKGYWSIPAGRMESSDKGDFSVCAAREACEEFFENSPQVREIIMKRIDKRNFIWFFIPLLYHFRMYFINSDFDIHVRHNHEFHETAWFGIDKLPEKTQAGVKHAVRRMKKLEMI